MDTERKDLTIHISTGTILKTLLILGAVVLLYLLRDVVLILLIAVVLASALNPWVNALQRRRIPRLVSTLIIFLIFFGAFALIIALLIPPITSQVTDITRNLPEYYNRVVSDFQQFRDIAGQQGLLNSLQNSLQSVQGNLGQGVFGGVVSVFGGLVSFMFLVVITFYMLQEENALKKFFRSVTPVKYQPYAFQLINRIQDSLRLWLQGQLILSLLIGSLAFVGLSIIGVKYSLVLGLWAGLTEFIPYLGPVIGGIPAVFIALTTGNLLQALMVVGLVTVINMLENYVVAPKVMQKAVGLNPLVVIIVMLVAQKMIGIIGVLIAIPITLIIKVFVEDFFALKEADDNTLEA